MRALRNEVIELVCRWYVFAFLNFYGLGKMLGMQFYRRGELPETVAQMTLGSADGFSLAWTFMGFSNTYILFIGSLQVIGAWLLLWHRTKLFGVLILLPIMVNIIVFDLIFLDQKGAVVNASIYLIMLLSILWINREQVHYAIKRLSKQRPKIKLNTKTILTIFILTAVIFAIDQLLVTLIGH